jgi:hypothetical protein
MLINIKNIKVYVVSPGEDKFMKRLLIVFERLVKYGFTNIEYFKSIPGKNSTESLTITILEIFKKEKDNDYPFIILEDDCDIFHKYESIKIPDNLDILYLGVSLWSYPYSINSLYLGIRPNIVENNGNTVKDYDETLTKIYGMTSGHAIMYKSRKFIKKFIEEMESIKTNVPHDLLLSSLHLFFNVYALKEPMFYQDGKLDGQEKVTKLKYNGSCYR